MADKKKVKTISSGGIKKGNKDKMDENKESSLQSAYEAEVLKEYNGGAKGRFKYIGAFMLGVVFSIALFSILGIHAGGRKVDLSNQAKIPYVGISMINLEDEDALEHFGIKVNTRLKRGVVVESVSAGSPAAGSLVKGDIINKYNGKVVKNIEEFKEKLYKSNAGDSIVLTIDREGYEKDITIVLDAKK